MHYGWVVAVVGTIGIAASIPGQTAGVSVYTEHLMASFGVSRLELSTMYLIGTMLSSFLLPLVGRLLDVMRTNIMMMIACFGLAGFLAYLSVLPQMHAWFLQSQQGSAPLVKYVFLLLIMVAFLGMRHFGQGQMTLISRTMIARWFERKRGVVVAVSGVAASFAFGGAPWILYHGVEFFGWQGNLQVCAGILCVLALGAFFLFRTSPEECGVEVDFQRSSQGTVGEKRESKQTGADLAEAKGTGIFWALTLIMWLQALAVTAITFHIEAIGAQQGVASEAAFGIFFPVAIAGTISHPVAGFLVGRVPYKAMLAVQALAMGVACLGVMELGSPIGYGATLVGLGVSGGLFSTLNGVAWAGIFGRRCVGAISGFSMGWMVFGSAIGPWLYGLSEKYLLSFQGANWFSATIAVGLAIFSLCCRERQWSAVVASKESEDSP